MTPDPIGLIGGINRYVYGYNNPINEIDPRGLDAGAGTMTAAIIVASGKGAVVGGAAITAGSALATGIGTFLTTTALIKYTSIGKTWIGRGGIGEWVYDITHARESSIWDDITSEVPDSAVDDRSNCEDDRSRDNICKMLYRIDTETCNAVTKVRGTVRGTICHASASQRYAECLRQGPGGVKTPLATWNN